MPLILVTLANSYTRISFFAWPLFTFRSAIVSGIHCSVVMSVDQSLHFFKFPMNLSQIIFMFYLLLCLLLLLIFEQYVSTRLVAFANSSPRNFLFVFGECIPIFDSSSSTYL
jgi:hypothetical protein